MSEQTTRTDADLEQALADLSAAVRFPATPSLVAGVRAALVAPPMVRWSRPASVRRSLAMALVAVLLVAGVAGAIGLGTGAITIRFADGGSVPTPMASVRNRGFGEPASLAEAQASMAFPIRLPADVELGPPDAIYVSDVPEGGTVSLVWGARPDYPADESGIGLVVTQFAADIGPDTFEKMILEGTRVESVRVNGQTGWWVEGGDHLFFYRDANGRIVDTTLRLVGSALIWDADGVAFRVEGAPTLEAAQKVAASLD